MKNTDTPSIERLKAALKPFARVCDAFDYWSPEAMPDFAYPVRGVSISWQLQDAPQASGELDEADFRRAAEALATLETLPSAGEGEQPDIEGRARETNMVSGTKLLIDALNAPRDHTGTEIRREALEEAAQIADRDASGSSEQEASSLEAARNDSSIAGREVELEYAVGYAKRASQARGIAAAIRALASKEPSPPSRPSFDKWDYAAAALADARCAK